jgi:hypothetical protein
MIEDLIKPNELSRKSVKRILAELDTLEGEDRDAALKVISYDILSRDGSNSILKIFDLGRHIFPLVLNQLLEVVEESLDNRDVLSHGLLALDTTSSILDPNDSQRKRLADIGNRIIDTGILYYNVEGKENYVTRDREYVVRLLEKYDGSVGSINRIRALAEEEYAPPSFVRFAKRRAYVIAKKGAVAIEDVGYDLDDYEAFNLPASVDEIRDRVSYFEDYRTFIEGYWKSYENDVVEELSDLVNESNVPREHIDLFFEALVDEDVSTHLFARSVLSKLYKNGIETDYIRKELLTMAKERSPKERASAISTLASCSKTEFEELFRNAAFDTEPEVYRRAINLVPKGTLFEIIQMQNHPSRGEALYNLSRQMLTDEEEGVYRVVLGEMLREGHVDSMQRVAQGLTEWGNADLLPDIIRTLELLDNPSNAEFIRDLPNGRDYVKRPEGVEKPLYVTGEWGEQTLKWPKEYLREAIAAIVAHEPLEDVARYIIIRPVEDISDMLGYFTPELKANLFFEYMNQPQREQLLESLLRRYERFTMPMMPVSMIEEAKEMELERTARELASIFKHVEDYDKVAKTIESWNPTILARILNNYDSDGQNELLSRFRPEIAGATEFMMNLSEKVKDDGHGIFSAYETLGFDHPDDVTEENNLIDAFKVKHDELEPRIVEGKDEAKREYNKVILAYEVAKADWQNREQRKQNDLLSQSSRAPWLLSDRRGDMERISLKARIDQTIFYENRDNGEIGNISPGIETYIGYDEIDGRPVVSVLTYVNVIGFNDYEIDMLSKFQSQMPPLGAFVSGYIPDIRRLVIHHFSESRDTILANVNKLENTILESIEIFKKAFGASLSDKSRYN